MSTNMDNFLKKFNIAVIFMLIGVFLWQNSAYSAKMSTLRIPIGTKQTKIRLKTILSKGSISEQYRKALLYVATEVARKYGTEFVLLLYGSVARGEARPDSDVDFAVDVPGETKNSPAGMDPAMDIAGDIFVNLIALGIPTDDTDPLIKAKHPEQIIRSYELKPGEYQLYFITPEGYEILNNIGMNELRGLAKSLKRARDNL